MAHVLELFRVPYGMVKIAKTVMGIEEQIIVKNGWEDFALYLAIHLTGLKSKTRISAQIFVMPVGCQFPPGIFMIQGNILIVSCHLVYAALLTTVTIILLIVYFAGLDILMEMIPVWY
jgi:hypothetical protein